MPRRRILLTFPENLITEPVIHTMGTRYGVVTNVRRANVVRAAPALAWAANHDRSTGNVSWVSATSGERSPRNASNDRRSPR